MNATSGAVIIPPDIAATTGPQLIGTLFNWLLFGVLSVQTYVYYLNFADDNLWNKLAVYGTFILEIVQTAMTAADLYFWYATGFGNLGHLGNVNISPADTPILCGIIAAVVQFFFAYRTYTLRQSYWLSGNHRLTAQTSILQTAGALGTGIRGFKLQEYANFHENVFFPQSFDVWLIGDAVCDVIIAETMSWLFFITRREGVQNGNRILGRLVRPIVETNTLTAGMVIVSFICYVTLPNSPLFIYTTLIMGKLYSNTLLVVFNNRVPLRKSLTHTVVSTFKTPASNDSNSTRRGAEDSSGTYSVGSNTFGAKSEDIYEIKTLTGTPTSPAFQKSIV